MAKGLAKAAVGSTAALALLCGSAAAQDQPSVGTIVLHVADYEGIQRDELASAQRLAANVYARIGVRLEWRAGSARLAAADGLRHFDVTVLNAEMTEKDLPAAGILGRASRGTRRASIYYPRVVTQAMRTNSDPTRVLAFVFAHEIGHMLLPEYSHATRGIMQPSCDRRIGRLPGFVHEQAIAIQAVVQN